MSAPHDDQQDPWLSGLLHAHVDAPPLRPGFHEDLEARLQATGAPTSAHPHRRGRLTARRLIAAAAVATAAAVLAFAVLPTLRGGGTATAADVLACMTAASDGAQTVRLHIVDEVEMDLRYDSGERQITRQVETTELTMSTSGDRLAAQSRQTSTGGDGPQNPSAPFDSVVSYDESRHEQRSGTSELGSRRFSIRRPAWPTDPRDEDPYGSDYASLAACLHAALAEVDPDTPVRDTTYLGRPAYVAQWVERWGMGIDGDVPVRRHWLVTVDKATGLPVAAESQTYFGDTKPALQVTDMHVTSMEFDPALADGWQLAPLPAHGAIPLIDEGTRFGTPEEVAERSWPTLPLIPQRAPAGYRLTDVASAGFEGVMSGPDLPWAPQGGGRTVGRSGRFVLKRVAWTMDGQTVLIRFRRGFSTFVVQIAPKALGEQLYDISPENERGEEAVTLTHGYLKGQRAATAITPYQGQGPKLVTYSERSRIVIWGDLTRRELIDVANSMKAYGDLDRGIMPGYGD